MKKKTTTKEVAITNPKKFTNEQIALITRTVAKGASMDELGLYFNVAKRVGLDPFMRQIHLIPRNIKQGNSYITIRTVQVGIDGYLAIAERTKQLAGIDDAIFDDGYKYEPGKEPKNPSKATVTVWRMVNGERVAFTASARWKEYFPGERLGFMWNKMPYGQLSKCALALALRKAFPTDLGGIYTNEEMDQAGEPAIEVIKGTKVEKKEKEEAVQIEQVNKDLYCQGCDIEINKTVADYSTKLYGKAFCRECQKDATKIV